MTVKTFTGLIFLVEKFVGKGRQFKMVSTSSENPIGDPLRLAEDSPVLPAKNTGFLLLFSPAVEPSGSPSRGGDVTVYVLDRNQPS